MAGATVRIKALDGRWQTIGTGGARGIVAEGLRLSANEAGPDSASFTLRRRTGLPWPDLFPFTPVDVEVGGTLVWSGRIWETPMQDGGDETIAVSCRGWQYHLDDNVYQKAYIKADLSEWIDATTGWAAPTAPLGGAGGFSARWKPFEWAAGQALATNDRAGIVIDGGYAGALKDVVVTLTHNQWAASGYASLRLDGSDTLPVPFASAVELAQLHNTTRASTAIAGSLAAGKRYLMLWVDLLGATAAADYYCRIESIYSYGSSSYRSGTSSTLVASTVVADALTHAPLLDQSTAGITTTSFVLPEFALDGYRTPREVMQAANAYHDYLLGVDVNKRLYFKPRPTTAVLEVGEWAGADWQDASANSADQLYNRVIVQATGPDGGQLNVVRTATSSLLTRQGMTRAAILPVSSALTTAAANQIGDAWLANHSSAKLKGSLSVTAKGGVRTVRGGVPLHPSELLLYPGQMIRLSNRIDPNTGAVGWDGSIASVTYDAERETASVAIDNERARLEAFLARLNIITGRAGR